MATGRAKSQWRQTSVLAALLANQWCADKSQLRTPDDFNPYAARRRKPAGSVKAVDTGRTLIAAFCR